MDSGKHMFGLVRRYITDTAARKLDKVARQHGATFVHVGKLPGDSIRGWFECQNLGEPFNSRTADEVLQDVNDRHPKIAAALGMNR